MRPDNHDPAGRLQGAALRRALGLYLVTDRALAGERSEDAIIVAALSGGVGTVQLRGKDVSGRALMAAGTRLGALVRATPVLATTGQDRALVIVNDRVDVALSVDADGAHVGQDDLPAAAARRLLGPQRLLGVSVSSVEEARQAAADGADYLGVGPIVSTPSKPDAPHPIGLRGLQAIRAITDLPLVAIGGITVANAPQVLAAGADGLAVIAAIVAAADPAAAAHALAAAVASAGVRADTQHWGHR